MKIEVDKDHLLIDKDVSKYKISQGLDPDIWIVEIIEGKKRITFSIEKELFKLLNKMLD
jgi:hypothetical protein